MGRMPHHPNLNEQLGSLELRAVAHRRPCSIAYKVAAARVVTPIFSKMCCRWLPAVLAEMSRLFAISLLVSPRESSE